MTPRHPMAIAVVAIVAGSYGIDPDIIWRPTPGKCGATIAEAKHLVSWVLRTRMAWSYPEIATALGTDHTTVMHGCKRTVARQESAQHTPAFSLAIKALSLEDINSLLPSISTVRALATHSAGTAAPTAPPHAPSLSESGSGSLSESSSPLSSLAKEPVSKPARGRKPRKPETEVPEDFDSRIRPLVVAWARKEHRREVEWTEQRLTLMREKCKAKGYVNRDWVAAARNWIEGDILKDAKFGTPPGFTQHAQQTLDNRRRPELRPLLPPRPVQEATPLEVLAHVGQVLPKRPAPPPDAPKRFTAAELDRAVDELQAGRGRT